MGTVGFAILPVYSVLDVTEDVVDAFSQSFSPFLLLERLGDRKPSAESGLEHTRAELNMSNAPEKNLYSLSRGRKVHQNEEKKILETLSQILDFI